MRFSLITCTVRRTFQLERLLDSLAKQSFQDFELIVVDQNPDDRLVDRLRRYQGRFRILHLRSALGASKARNAGLAAAQGEIVAFPDDDCWYPGNLLEKVTGFFSEHPGLDGLTGRPVDRRGKGTLGRYSAQKGFVSLGDLFRKATAVTMFVTRQAAQKAGGFDEKVGPGAGTIYVGAEDLQYLMKVLKAGCRVYYSPSIVVYHNEPLQGYGPHAVQRGYSYGCGFGYVLRREGYPAGAMLSPLLRPLAGSILFLLTGKLPKARYHWASLRGRLRGWLSTRPERVSA